GIVLVGAHQGVRKRLSARHLSWHKQQNSNKGREPANASAHPKSDTAHWGGTAHIAPRSTRDLSASGHSIDEQATPGDQLLAKLKSLDNLDHVAIAHTGLYRP